jgi:hypothetical protein
MLNREDKIRILNGKINEVSNLINLIEPYKDGVSENKPSNQYVLDGLISEKNTYSQLLAEL